MDDYKDYCIREAKFHLDRAREILMEAMQDPKKYHDETKKTYEFMAPWYAMMMYSLIHAPPDDTPEISQNLSTPPLEDR
jgi:1,2-phenylacetyl-CoA epoxidase catalytic subunit